MRDRLLPVILLAVPALALAACSDYNDERGRGDAPVGERLDGPADVIFFPDEFSNVAVKCHGGNGIYVTTQNTNGKQMTVIPNDPICFESELGG